MKVKRHNDFRNNLIEMGRINYIIQRHIDERIEQKLTFLTERMAKLETTVLELKSEISDIRKEHAKVRFGDMWQ